MPAASVDECKVELLHVSLIYPFISVINNPVPICLNKHSAVPKDQTLQVLKLLILPVDPFTTWHQRNIISCNKDSSFTVPKPKSYFHFLKNTPKNAYFLQIYHHIEI
jgi:hypothetical protein